MASLPRQPANYEDILLAVETQLVDTAGFLQDNIGMGLAEDIGDWDPKDSTQFLYITPGRLALDMAMVAGGGSDLNLVQATVKVFLWTRSYNDSEFHDKSSLTDKATGIFPVFRRIWTALSQFDPETPDGTGLMLFQPMRLLSPQIRARRVLPSWLRLASEWQTWYTQALPGSTNGGSQYLYGGK